MRGALLALVLSGCMGRVHDYAPTEAVDALEGESWCVVATVHSETVVACVRSRAWCESRQKVLRRRGALVGVTQLSVCQRVGGER